MMRDYSKVSPRFWTGETGQALAARGSEALVVALYLMTSPHSNMLGLYYQPILYMAEETGLSPEGASEGLMACIEEGFCRYDTSTKMVWVEEMASYQIGSELDSRDNRCKGIEKDYAALPNCPFLGPFFDRYRAAFHLPTRREFVPKPRSMQRVNASPIEAPTKPGTGTGTGTGAGTGAGTGEEAFGFVGSADPLPCPFDEIVEAYHQTLPELPRVRLKTAKRQRAMKSLWQFVLTRPKSDGTPRATNADEALAWIRAYFERARDNDFLMGRTPRVNGHEGWQCDLDFLLSEKGLKHVIEKTREQHH